MNKELRSHIERHSKHKRTSITESPFPLKGRDWLGANPQLQERLVDLAFRFWRRRGFPYYDLSPSEIEAEYRRILVFDSQRIFVRNALRGPSLGLSLANYFHPAMWSVRVSRYRCPMDVFEDDALLRSAIRRAFRIWPTRYSANASCLRRMLKTFSSSASVSNFKPLIAKAVIEKYSETGDTVLDFCAGYGGRLLGSLTLPRTYVGIEPCREQVAGLRRMIRAISRFTPPACNATILEGCAENTLKKVPSCSIGLVFSSPPYFDWEKYARHSTQSFVRYKTYSEWLQNFLSPVIAETCRVLRKKGHLVLNVTNGRRNPSREEVDSLGEQHGLKLRRSHRLILPKVPYLHPRNGLPEKYECLLVFTRK
jgi:hypothetical protein